MAFDDDIKQAQAAMKKREHAKAVAALERALDDARAKAPLEVRQAVAIHHDHTGLGVYTPAPGDVVEGRRARLYVEVANHTHTRVGSPGSRDGERWRVQLDVSGDFAYEDVAENGSVEVIKLQTVSLGTQSYETRTPSGVTSFGVEIKLGDKSPAGTYRVVLHVKDAVGGKSASRDVRLVLT